MLYKNNIDPCSKSKSVDELLVKLRKLIIVYQENLYHAQNFQKRTYNKSVKPRSYAPSDKV